MTDYKATIGLEVHVQLKTRSKMFCSCSTEFGAEPNTHVCPVCLGYPGAMPVMNGEAIKLTVMTGLMLGCDISEYSKFDRKSYFYPDMPKNYQISQYDKPLCERGTVEIDIDGESRSIGLTRIHLEEDVAKNMHFHDSSGVDFNRAGVPLMEVVSDPDIHSPEEAYAYLQALRQNVIYAGVSDCNLEEGNMRCDVNVSVAPDGSSRLGTKAEIKNMNTFKGVLNALKYEIARQIDEIESGGRIVQETRRWDPDRNVTSSMRTKEDAHDYRYFPEPDLMPVVLSRDQVMKWSADLPESPRGRRVRIVSEYGLPEYDAAVLVSDKSIADFFEAAAGKCGNAKAVSNLVMTEVLRLLSESEKELADVPITPEALAGLVELVDAKTLNSNTAKEVLGILFEVGGDPKVIVEERGLTQVSDSGVIDGFVDRAIAENPKSVADFKNGKEAAIQFLVGQVMRMSRGKANPQMVAQLLRDRLA